MPLSVVEHGGTISVSSPYPPPAPVFGARAADGTAENDAPPAIANGYKPNPMRRGIYCADFCMCLDKCAIERQAEPRLFAGSLSLSKRLSFGSAFAAPPRIIGRPGSDFMSDRRVSTRWRKSLSQDHGEAKRGPGCSSADGACHLGTV
jgi:hypothetical protein